MLGLLASMLLASSLLAGCGGPNELTVQGTDLAPGADAHISADIDADAAITRLGVHVVHLPPPERIDPGGKHFVVWQRPNAATPWQRVGVLNYDGGSREGEMAEMSVPHADFELLITVEAQRGPRSPSNAVIIAPTSIR